jgi:hypothetical protein
VTFPPAEAAPALALREIRPGGHVRRSEVDQRSGIVSLIIEDDFGEYENPDHGGIAGSVARERWDIHPGDPLSARGWADWTQVVERDGLRLRTEATSEMWSDATAFHLKGTLRAWTGADLVFERTIEREVPRDLR